jgi:dihydrofolate synthase/folylpolyglutamate synthase
MNYNETLEYLFSQLPMFHRIGAAAYKANLDNTLALDKYLGHPHKNFKSIHIAGTNGKGSVSHMLASILQQAGYKTGLYTSPHLKDFRERIKINGKEIPEHQVIEFVEKHKTFYEQI